MSDAILSEDVSPVAGATENTSTDSTAQPEADAAPVHPRQALYEQIAAKRREREAARQAEAAPEEAPEETPEVGAETETETETPAATPQAPVYERDGQWFARRKVDGVEEEVPLEQVLAAHQKTVAADRRLEEAARARQALDQARAEIMQREQALRALEGQVREQQHAQVRTQTQELVRQYHEALMEGDTEKASTMWSQIQPAAGPTPAPAQITPEVVDNITNAAVARFKQNTWLGSEMKAREWLNTEHADITQDARLMQIASNEAETILRDRIAEGRRRDPHFSAHDVDPMEVYRSAVANTKDWLKKTSGSATSGFEARHERKRSATSKTAPGNSQRAQLRDNTPRGKTNAEKIADMRKARGLPV